MSWSLCCLGLGDLTASKILFYGLLLLLTWLAYKIIKPLWSPLRNYPGLPYIPVLGNLRYLMTGEAMSTHIRMIQKFGSVVHYYFMFGSERLLVASPELMKHIFVTNSRNYPKPLERFRLLELLLGKGLLTTEGDLHTVHKRLMSPAFSSHSISKMFPVFKSHIQQLVETWSTSISKSGSHALLPIQADLQRTTLDVIGKTAFGYEFNSLSNPDHPVCSAFHDFLTGFALSWRTALPFYTYLPFPDMRKVWKCLRLMDGVVYKIINEKRKLIDSQTNELDRVTGDVLGKMMLARDEETSQCLSDKELRDQVMTLMLAGHETTAVGMSWCLLMLATHPEIQNKARDEILSVVDATSGLTYDNIDQLEYCGYVVRETLRLLPPVPMTIRVAEKDDVLPGGYQVPAGTIINMSLGPMMRREELYSDAESFMPERYMDKNCESSVYQFAPFIYGPKQCLGYRFALVEMKTMLAVLLPRLRFDLDPAGPKYQRSLSLTMKPKPSLQLIVSLVD